MDSAKPTSGFIPGDGPDAKRATPGGVARSNEQFDDSAGRGPVVPDPEELTVRAIATGRTGVADAGRSAVCTAATATDERTVAADASDTSGGRCSQCAAVATRGREHRTELCTGSEGQGSDSDVVDRYRRSTGTAAGTTTATTGATTAAAATTTGFATGLVAAVSTVATVATATGRSTIAAVAAVG